MTRSRSSPRRRGPSLDQEWIPACAGMSGERPVAVRMHSRTTLFDIVNVQNWPAASASRGAEVPVARSLPLLGMIYFDHAGESGAAGPLSIFSAGLAQREERRPRNAEAACSSHAAGTTAFVAQLEEQSPGTR